MLGSMLSGTGECPGKILKKTDGSICKVYRGMARREAQLEWRGKSSAPEGGVSEGPFRGSISFILEDISGRV